MLLHLRRIVHDVDRQNALGLNLLSIGPIRGRVDHDLGGVHGCDHLLLHLKQASRLLDTSCRHVHRRHTRVALAVDEHLLLGRLLVILVLASLRVVKSLLRGIAIDDGRLAEGTAHLPWDAHLRDVLVRVHSLGIGLHCNLLRAHKLLLLLVRVVRLALVHAALIVLILTLVNRLAQLVHTVSVRAVVLIGASLTGIEMFAHDSLVVLKAALTVGLAVVAATLVSTLQAAATTTATSTTGTALEAFIFRASHSTINAASHIITSVLLLVHTTSPATAAHLIISRAATLDEALVATSSAMRIASVASTAAIAASLMVLVTATATVAASAAVAATMTVATAATLAGNASVALTASVVALTAATLAHVVATDDAAASLRAHMIWDGVVNVSELGIAVSVLAVFIILTVALVLKVATLLSLEALIDLAVLNGATNHLLLLLARLLLHHLLRLHHMLVHLLRLLVRVHHHGLLLLIGMGHHRHRGGLLAWLLLLGCVKVALNDVPLCLGSAHGHLLLLRLLLLRLLLGLLGLLLDRLRFVVASAHSFLIDWLIH